MTDRAHKILDHGELPEGRVTTVTIGLHTRTVTNHEGPYGCLDNHCPHQEGPLGEGSIEGGYLRCPFLSLGALIARPIRRRLRGQPR